MTDFEKQREWQRIEVESFRISLCLSGNDAVNAVIDDLSAGGIRISCDRITAHKIQHEYDSTREKKSTRFPVNFILPMDNGQDNIEAVCRMIYIIKQAHDNYAVGLEFADIDDKTRKTLMAYVEDQDE